MILAHRKRIQDLPKDIEHLLEAGYMSSDLTLDQSNRLVVEYAKNMAIHMLDTVDVRRPRAKDPAEKVIRMSELGEPCIRKLYYKWYAPSWGRPPYGEMNHPMLQTKFLLGDYIEETIAYLAEHAGWKVQNKQRTVMIQPDSSEWMALGHLDFTFDDYVVDAKSAADGSFKKYKREGLTADNDMFGYRWQLDAYAYAMSIDRRAFVFMNKHDGEIHVEDCSSQPMLPVVDRVASIGNAIDRAVQRRILPPRLPPVASANGDELSVPCRYCNFKYVCWRNEADDVEFDGYLGTRPYFMVTLNEKGKKFFKGKTKIEPPPSVPLRGPSGSIPEIEEIPF